MPLPNGLSHPSTPTGSHGHTPHLSSDPDASSINLSATPNTPSSSRPDSSRLSKSVFGLESNMSVLVDSLRDRVLLAVPKKGRLHERCLELLNGADIKYNRAHRLDVALVQNHPIALVFLPAADIPRFVALGSVALGMTGQDVIAESTHANAIKELLPLGFGKCALQVQVPVNSPLQTIEQLSGGRIATSFEVLTGEFFEGVDKKVNGKGKTKVEYVGGSVEAACALGMADGIVDLVESGDTMRAAGLHAIHTLLTSEAVLITSTEPHSSLTPELAPIIPLIKSRFAGVLAAKRYVYCSYNIERSNLPHSLKITPGRRAPTVSALEEEGWVAVSSMVEKKEVARVMDDLQKTGAEDILIFALDNCRVGV